MKNNNAHFVNLEKWSALVIHVIIIYAVKIVCKIRRKLNIVSYVNTTIKMDYLQMIY